MANTTRREAPTVLRATRSFAGLASLLAMAFAVCLVPFRGLASGHGDSERGDQPTPLARAEASRGGEEIPFDDVKFIIEHNATAEDTGIQVFLDGKPWNRLKIEGPEGGPLLEVRARGHLRTLGLTEFFFETNEPPNAEVPIPEVLARFPEGEYEFEGRSIDGVELTGTATLTHDIPKGPRILSPTEGEVVDPNNTVIRWEAVTESITGEPVEIVGYQVIIGGPGPGGPGFSGSSLDVHLPASARSLRVPPEFLAPGTEWDLEVLALEVGGNQTISSSNFVTK